MRRAFGEVALTATEMDLQGSELRRFRGVWRHDDREWPEGLQRQPYL